MTVMKKVLSGTVKGGTTDALARELDMNRSTLMAMIDFLASAGYLEITGLQCSCQASNLCEKSCGSNSGSQTKMYALTLKGEQFLS
ncbi:MAG: hypothetical protein K8R06_09400 [Methanosarcinales archaeon]|nr:hypothetical protein [Methanosarcinales archaeon]MCD4799161.1 hypothetical protein [Methanosarcinales archaeon]MCD4816596.1 hypothetical protein [Methanosarcinales archaeon]